MLDVEPVSTYTITVETADLPNAAADVQISVVLVGPSGQISEVWGLPGKDADGNRHFQRGQHDEFKSRLRTLPSVEEVLLKLEPLDPPSHGHLHSRSRSRDGGSAAFAFTQWRPNRIVLTSDAGTSREQTLVSVEDGMIEELESSDSGTPTGMGLRVAMCAAQQYAIKVRTGSEGSSPHMHTHSAVHARIDLDGSLARSGPVFLSALTKSTAESDEKLRPRFQPGQADTFVVWLPPLGEIERLRLCQVIGDKGSNSWTVERVTVRRPADEDCALFVLDDQPVPRYGDGTAASALELHPCRGDHYTIRLLTGRPSGSLASLKPQERPRLVLTLRSCECEPIAVPLVRSDQSRPFRRGRLDTFEFDLPRFETLIDVSLELIRTEGTRDATWHVEKLFVKKNRESENAAIMWVFDFACWLRTPAASGGRCEHRCWRPQPPLAAESLAGMAATRLGWPVRQYRIDILTGNHWRGGTSAMVNLVLNGCNYTIGLKMAWKRSVHRRPFQAGQHDVFLFDGQQNHNLPELGGLHSISLNLESADTQRWSVERVEFHDLSAAGLVWIFPCDLWLDAERPSAVLSVAGKPGTEADGGHVRGVVGKRTEYTVQITTAAEAGSSDVDAEIFVELLGSVGSSGPLRLESSNNEWRFVQGQEDSFIFVLPSLGDLASLKLWRSARRACPELCERRWRLQSVVVFDGWLKRTTFSFDDWVADEPVQLFAGARHGDDSLLAAAKPLALGLDGSRDDAGVLWEAVESQRLLCPITAQLMSDPVVCVDGHTYEREAIESWLRDHDTSPITNLPLSSKMLIPNHLMRHGCIPSINKHAGPADRLVTTVY